jgi:hypothetical protein
MTEPSGYEFETLWEDVDFVLSRPVREAESSPLQVGAPASAQPSPASLARLEHAYSRRDELSPAWAARPFLLVRDRGGRPSCWRIRSASRWPGSWGSHGRSRSLP